MFKRLLLSLVAMTALTSAARADSFGQGVEPTGPTKQIAASGTSANVALTAESDYILVWNEGSVFAYVTCRGTVAAVPGGSGFTANSTPVGPNGGLLLRTTYNSTLPTCAAITAGSLANVDFTPINLF